MFKKLKGTQFFYHFGEIFFSLKKVTKYLMRMSKTHFGRNFFAFRCKNNKLKSTLKIIFEVFENIANGKAGTHKFQV